MREQLDYIGSGINDPLNVTSGELSVSTDFDRLEQSIRRTLGEATGTRFFNRGFGSRINELLGEPNDEVLKDLVPLFIREALFDWEPRVKINRIEITQGTDHMIATITYTVIAANVNRIMTWPFYRIAS